MPFALIVVTLCSLGLAAVMTVVAWRLARNEQRRQPSGASDRPKPAGTDVPGLDLRPAPPRSDRRPPASSPAVRPVSHVALGLVGVLAVAAALAALAVPLGGGVATTTAAATPPAGARAPLELLSLGHDFAAGTLTVSGIVRNPGHAAAEHLTAVVTFLDRAGAPLTSARADLVTLEAGEEPFSVSVPDADGLIGRYRVSFFQGRVVVPHVDRRRDRL
jgi:hypothetical protein